MSSPALRRDGASLCSPFPRHYRRRFNDVAAGEGMQTLPIIDELEAALASGTNARRVEMLTRITDLFVGGARRFSETQTGVFDDVMARLVSAIEAKARAKLAHRLAPDCQRSAQYGPDARVRRRHRCRGACAPPERLDDAILLTKLYQ
jgi:hypothetical protein